MLWKKWGWVWRHHNFLPYIFWPLEKSVNIVICFPAVNKNNSIRPYLNTYCLNDLRKKEEDKVFSPASIASKICSHDNSTRRMTMDLCIQGLLDNIWTWKLRNWRGWKSDQSAGFSYCSFLSFVLCQYLNENKSTKLYYFSSEWVLFVAILLVIWKNELSNFSRWLFGWFLICELVCG